MSRKRFMRWLTGGLMLSGWFGCNEPERSTPVSMPIEQAWESPAPARPAREREPAREAAIAAPQADAAAEVRTPPPPASEVIATVNGEPVLRSELVELLIAGHGLNLLEQQILTIAAKQRLESLSLRLTREDVAAAHQDAIRRLATPIGASDDQPLDPQAVELAERLLQDFLVAKNISLIEWDHRMEQYACLRKIAEAEVTAMEITESMLREEYQLAYGERVQLRHIQLSSQARVAAVRSELRAGRDFELVARQHSENQLTAAQGGLMPPITRHDPSITPLIRDAAFSMDEGEVSPPIHEDNWFHIIRIERRFQASGVRFEDVDHERLRGRLRERLIRQRQEELEPELFQGARVQIRHDELRRRFQRRHGQPARRAD